MGYDEHFRFRGSAALKRAWVELCAGKNIPQSDAFTSLVQFLLAQDDLTQSMILGQVKPRPDLTEFILRRLTKK